MPVGAARDAALERAGDLIIRALAAAGGAVRDPKGRVSGQLQATTGLSAENLRKHLVRLEAEGVLTRRVNGRICYEVALTTATAIDEAPGADDPARSRHAGGRPRGPRVKVYPPTPTCRYYKVIWRQTFAIEAGELIREERRRQDYCKTPDEVDAWLRDHGFGGLDWRS